MNLGIEISIPNSNGSVLNLIIHYFLTQIRVIPTKHVCINLLFNGIDIAKIGESKFGTRHLSFIVAKPLTTEAEPDCVRLSKHLKFSAAWIIPIQKP